MSALPLSATRSSTPCSHYMPTTTKPASSCNSRTAIALQQLQGSMSTPHWQGCCCKGFFLASGCKSFHHQYSRRGSCCSHRGGPQRCARCLASQHEDITERHGPLQGTSLLLPTLVSIHLSVCPDIHPCVHAPIHSLYIPGHNSYGASWGSRGPENQSCTVKSEFVF